MKRFDSSNYVRVDGMIRARLVRVITPDGQNLGVLPIEKARMKAEEFGLNLIEISPNANPPVCKIVDFGKYKYEVARKKRESKSKTIESKEIRFRLGTDEHDLSIKVQRGREFLADGNRVTFTLVLRGREQERPQIAVDILKKIQATLDDCSKPLKDVFQMGRSLHLILIASSNQIIKKAKLDGGPNAETKDGKSSNQEIKSN
ncbi:MAG: translation initiation factor IF-3 [Planctomycetes bacterium]|nr:translation initiation factor IF-3 [Planctomycetota bacterium]